MEKYLLLRNNEQSGPYSYENLIRLGLLPQDLIWIDGKSASWRYPAEMDEFMMFIPATTTNEIRYDQPPLSKTHLQNDDILVRDLNTEVRKIHYVISDNELMEFPTLARFLMADYYEQQHKKSIEKNGKDPVEQKPLNGSGSGVWVSLPAKSDNKRIILIKANPPAFQSPLISENVSDQSIAVESSRTVIPESNYADSLTSGVRYIQEKFHPEGTDNDATVEETVHFHFESTNRRKHFVPLQWLSIAVALASLLMVGVLVVNSVINPGYSTSLPSGKQTKEASEKLQPDPGGNQSSELALYAGAALIPTVTLSGDSLNASVNKDVSLVTPAIADKKVSAVKKVTEKKPELVPAADPLPSPPVSTETDNTKLQSDQALETEKDEARKNIFNLVKIETDGFKVGILGGIREFDVIVKNNSNFSIDRVVVELKYIQSNKKVFKTETLEFRDIAAKSDRRIEVPKSPRGVKVETLIRSIASDDLSVSYSN